MIHALIVVCGSTWCEPTVVTYAPMSAYYDGYFVRPTTAEWCRNSLPFHLRDLGRVSPETKDTYYLDPARLGVPGLVFLPDASTCWPLREGPV